MVSTKTTRGNGITKQFLVAAVLTALLLPLPVSSQSPANPLGLHAYLFYSTTGQLSKDILAEGGPELGNTVTSSNSTFVVVEVKPQPGQHISSKAQIHLTAIESGEKAFAADAKHAHHPDRLILDKTSRVGTANEKGISFVGFWLENTGCAPVTLKASIVGVPGPPQTAMLEFACYE